jgi:hypothetical protein
MTKAKITVRSVIYETYEIDVPDEVMKLHEEDDIVGYIQDHFLSIDIHELFAYLIDTDSYSWDIDDMEIVKG